jgi:hypothetical protein
MTASDRHNDLNVPWTVIAGFVGCILVFAFIIAVQILFQRAEQAQYRQKIVAQVPEQVSRLRAEQEARINSYRMVDEKKGIAAIPIDEAVQVFVRDPAKGMQVIRAGAGTQPASAAQIGVAAPASGTEGTRPRGGAP